MNLTPEERAVGKDNFHSVIGSELTRREFLLGAAAGGLVSAGGLGAYYFGYGKSVGDPLRVGFIGTGDEGGVLIGAHNPEYMNVVAIADIRPYSVHRAFHGDQSSPNAYVARPGLMKKYDWGTEDEARKHVKVYGQDYQALLGDDNVEAVVIALPLHLHAKVAIEAMRAGKHVLTEKLMGQSVHECKEMGRVAKETNKYLVTGHQRHYSILYDNAVDTIRRGVLGTLHHIRAQWHRGNLPGHDSWQPMLPADAKKHLDKINAELAKLEADLNNADGARITALLEAKALREHMAKDIILGEMNKEFGMTPAEHYGYESKSGYTNTDGKPKTVSPIEELIRWRLWDRTGGGLMAELGSHQLDAAGIFISAMQEGAKKALPLTVTAVGGRHVFPHDRDVDDHVYCTYEFPRPDYDPQHPQRKHNKIVVTYSSINGNDFGGYGEVVMGTSGTMILEREQEVMLFGGDTKTKVGVSKKKGDDVVLDTTQSGGASAAVGKGAVDSGPISRGYTEEMEHWAWCVRNPSPENQPKCHPKVALGDAVIALTTNIAIKEQRPIEFKHEWFEIDSDDTPEGVKPDVKRYKA